MANRALTRSVLLILAAALFLSLAACGTQSSAESIPHEIITDTDRRNVFSYIELYTSRYIEDLQRTGSNRSYIVTEPLLSPYREEDPNGGEPLIVTEAAPGTLYIHPEDYTLAKVLMTFMVINGPESTNETALASCVVAMSALEYDYNAGEILKLGPNSATAVDITLSILSENVLEAYKKAGSDPSCFVNEPVLIYSGNYDYFLQAFAPADQSVSYVLYLIAQERK